MPKTLSSFVALLLIPCLVVDPSWASVSFLPAPHSAVRHSDDLFKAQAVTQQLEFMHQTYAPAIRKVINWLLGDSIQARLAVPGGMHAPILMGQMNDTPGRINKMPGRTGRDLRTIKDKASQKKGKRRRGNQETKVYAGRHYNDLFGTKSDKDPANSSQPEAQSVSSHMEEEITPPEVQKVPSGPVVVPKSRGFNIRLIAASLLAPIPFILLPPAVSRVIPWAFPMKEEVFVSLAVGLLIMFIGSFVLMKADEALKWAWDGMGMPPAGPLEVEGFLKWTRNPMHVGYLLTFTGASLAVGAVLTAFDSPLGNAASLYLIVSPMIYKFGRWAQQEEIHNLQKFGADYRDYAARTPLFPFWPLRITGISSESAVTSQPTRQAGASAPARGVPVLEKTDPVDVPTRSDRVSETEASIHNLSILAKQVQRFRLSAVLALSGIAMISGIVMGWGVTGQDATLTAAGFAGAMVSIFIGLTVALIEIDIIRSRFESLYDEISWGIKQIRKSDPSKAAELDRLYFETKFMRTPAAPADAPEDSAFKARTTELATLAAALGAWAMWALWFAAVVGLTARVMMRGMKCGRWSLRVSPFLPEGIRPRFGNLVDSSVGGEYSILPAEREVIQRVSDILGRAQATKIAVPTSAASSKRWGVYHLSPLDQALVGLRELDILKIGDSVQALGSGFGTLELAIAKRFDVYVHGMEMDPTRLATSWVAKDIAVSEGFLREDQVSFEPRDFLNAEVWNKPGVFYYFSFGGSDKVAQMADLAIHQMQPGSKLVVLGLKDFGRGYKFDAFFAELFVSGLFDFEHVPGLGIWVFIKKDPMPPLREVQSPAASTTGKLKPLQDRLRRLIKTTEAQLADPEDRDKTYCFTQTSAHSLSVAWDYLDLAANEPLNRLQRQTHISDARRQLGRFINYFSFFEHNPQELLKPENRTELVIPGYDSKVMDSLEKLIRSGGVTRYIPSIERALAEAREIEQGLTPLAANENERLAEGASSPRALIVIGIVEWVIQNRSTPRSPDQGLLRSELVIELVAVQLALGSLVLFGVVTGVLGAALGARVAYWRLLKQVNAWGVQLEGERKIYRQERFAFALLGFLLGAMLGLGISYVIFLSGLVNSILSGIGSSGIYSGQMLAAGLFLPGVVKPISGWLKPAVTAPRAYLQAA